MSKWQTRLQWGGLAAGPLAAVLVYQLLPVAYRGIEGEAVAFTPAGRATLAVMAWMAAWWLTEAVPIAATALVPLAAFPLAGILPIGRAAAPYGSELIFLFIGGFVLALSMQRWGLDRRIALTTLRFVGTRPANVIGGFMLVTATLSMWVSNTATAAMMLPIGLSVIDLVFSQQHGSPLSSRGALPAEDVKGRNFALSLMLGIAYAASIGGIATIIGSPPNGILVQFLKSELGQEISFARWMAIGGPLVLVFLPVAWVLITWVLYPIRIERIEGGRELVDSELRRLGAMQRGEWITMTVFFATAALWISRPLLVAWPPLEGLSDAGIAILAALALFVIPAATNPPTFTMDWETAVKLPWGVLILFGGGLSLAAAVQANGVAEFLGAQVTALGGMPTVLFVLAVTTGVIFLTELTSNTATTATLVPVLAGVAQGIGVHADYLIFPATIAASCAFMMPVATPPNAIVFGSGYVTIPQMCKAGLWLNLSGIVLITAVMYLLVIPLLGLGR